MNRSGFAVCANDLQAYSMMPWPWKEEAAKSKSKPRAGTSELAWTTKSA